MEIMTATVYHLPVSPRFRTLAKSLPEQPEVIPFDPLERQAWDLWAVPDSYMTEAT
jgi:hypothetical protein